VHPQAREQLDSSLSLVAIRHVHGAAWTRRHRTPGGLPGLDGGLLVGAHDEVPLPGQ
jgi:hypothetical protein